MSLEKKVDEITKQFEVSQELLQKGVDLFVDLAEKGLQSDDDALGMPMIPTYVNAIPTGREKGVFLAADLGGTNFRVCSVTLKGNHHFDLKQSKNPIPIDLMKGDSSDALFSYLASKIKSFVETNHPDHSEDQFNLGFTFSFPVHQNSLDSGYLIRWTKGFDIADTVNQDVVELLQKHLNALQTPVRVKALANDTVGTLLSRAYSAGAVAGGKQGDTLIGCIFGTGTNGAYPEKLENIKKLPESVAKELKELGVSHMVINTEWGSFDNRLQVLPKTVYDEKVDALTANKGFHMFEKRVSGMFLGEILRQIIVDLHQQGLLLVQYEGFEQLPHRLRTPWELGSETLSLMEIDDSTELKTTELTLLQTLRLPTTPEERTAIQQLTRAVSKRAAHLAAIPLAGIIVKTGVFESGVHKEVDIGSDGSVVEYYPGFRAMIRDALALTQIGNKGERRVHINIAKDGSGVGAALCALSGA